MLVHCSGCPLTASTARITCVHRLSEGEWLDVQIGYQIYVVDRSGAYFHMWAPETGPAIRCWSPHNASRDRWEPFMDAPPSRHDPATVGCLLALLREAMSAPFATAQHSEAVGWCVYSARGEMLWADQPQHATEGEAIAAALIALAQEAP
jgi:hypothetical protein